MGIDLFNRCKEFEKIAGELSVSKISKEENSDPVLKELSNLKEFKDRVKLAEKHYKKLGKGSSRTVFQMDDKCILKVAHSDKGIQQNLVEMDPKKQRACTNNVLVADAKSRWIIMPFTETVSKESFKKITGFGFTPFMNALFYKFNNESREWSPPKDYEDIQKSDLFKCVSELVLECDSQLGDYDKPSSWGQLDNKVVIRDYGLDRNTYDKMYDGKSKSSTKSKPKTSEE
jgi:hypothetical protein